MNVDRRVCRGRSGWFLAWGICLAAVAAPAQIVWLNQNQASAYPSPISEGAPGDRLQFLDGTFVHGELKGMDDTRGLRWSHPDAKNAFDVRPNHIDSLRLAQAQSVAMSPTCHLRFASGDDLFGSLVSLDREDVEFNTWFGGTMKIPRAALQTITFLPQKYSIIYEGPSDATGWVISGVRQMGFRMRGGMGMIGGMAASGGNQGGPPYWVYRDGSFIATGAGILARDFKLTGSSTIEFDLAAKGSFNLLLDLYSPTLERIDYNSSSFIIELDSGQILLRRAGRYSVPNDLGSVQLTNFEESPDSHVTVHCNKEEKAVSVLVNGVVVKRWSDIGDFSDVGSGILFQNQSAPGAVKLSNFKVSEWEGRYEPAIISAPATHGDLISFINRDQAGGKINGISAGKLDVELGGHVLRVPLERVRQIDFATNTVPAEPRGPWEVRAIFPGGGSVSFQLDHWDEKTVSGRSALFGSLAFQPASIREVEFNLDRVRNKPAASAENSFDALDQ